MKYCKRCLYPETHPLGLTFDNDSICSGCRVHEEKDIIDWNEREQKLISLLKQFKKKKSAEYDCIVPISGARDSYFIVHIIKKKLKLNPLLVSYNKQYNTILGFRNIDYLRTIFDCDFIQQTVNPFFIKRLTEITFEEFGSIYWHCIAGQTVFPVKVAVNFGIPLIIWGVHQGIDQVGMFSHLDEVEMTRKYRKEHDLMGYEAEDVYKLMGNINFNEFEPFIYPTDKEIQENGVRGIYLNNFYRWDSKAQHEEMIKLYDYQSFEQNRTFNTYEDIDCLFYSDVHDYIKFVKHGYGKVTDHASREIRLKRLTREEGIEIVNKYQYKKMKNLNQFLRWLNISEDKFNITLEKFRNLKIWDSDNNGNWVLKEEVSLKFHSFPEASLGKVDECDYKLTGYISKNNKKKLFLYARGYEDE